MYVMCGLVTVRPGRLNNVVKDVGTKQNKRIHITEIYVIKVDRFNSWFYVKAQSK